MSFFWISEFYVFSCCNFPFIYAISSFHRCWASMLSLLSIPMKRPGISFTIMDGPTPSISKRLGLFVCEGTILVNEIRGAYFFYFF